MQRVSVFILLGILAGWSCEAVFLNHRPFPTYSLENMPSTEFSCRQKILGGYYADPDTECQMFHVCVKVAGIGVQDFRFLCPNGTAFDQDHQICAEWEDVDCDASTLYYSSDNFDLYRVGSGFESKAHKYGEDEETFALQRAETGDVRLNREPQTQVVNQQKEYQKPQARRNLNNQQSNQDKDIFKTSSSSNFFNNRNNGKENDEDYDDNVNVNQNRDYEQRRKSVRKPQRRPSAPEENYPKVPEQQQQTRRPNQRPTGFVNNFAGSSYTPTTSRPTTTTTTTQAPAVQVQQSRARVQRPVNTQSNNPPTPTYTVSTPAPFRQSPKNTGQYYTTSSTENYPQPRLTNNPLNYDVPKATKQQTENYPSNNPQYSKSTTPFVNSQYNTAFDKKPTTYKKQDYKPTTFSPNAKPFSFPKNQNTQQTFNSFPTTFAPRTQQAYTQIAQQTNTFNTQNPTQNTFAQQNYNSPSSTTQRTTSFSQYTPTVPKISSTTPVSRSNRFDETSYDDGSYDPKYDYNGGGEEEFLKAAHSQNIASSRNELLRTQQKQQQQAVTTTQRTTQRTHDIPSRKATENYPKPTPIQQKTTVTQKPTPSPSKPPSAKKVKDVSYDYAYYDSLGPEPDYQIDTEIKKEVRGN